MNEKITNALKTLAESALIISEEINMGKAQQELIWKKDLATMISENKTDTAEVFAKYDGFINRRAEEEKEYCSKRVIASLKGFFEEPHEPKCLDDAMEHLKRFIELTRR